jgi:hypothetical protein
MNEPRLRKDFEIACLFRKDMFVGALVTDDDGKFVNDKIESMYQGYVMGRYSPRGRPDDL